MKIKDLLGLVDHIDHSVPQTGTVAAAIEQLQTSQTRVLIATAGETPVGVFGEREVLHCLLAHRGRPLSDILVQEVMTRQPVVAEAEAELAGVVDAVLQADATHLAVMDAGRLAGVLPLGALVRQRIDSLTAELHYLQDYISDLHEADQD
jgi:IMP dehydrogenase